MPTIDASVFQDMDADYFWTADHDPDSQTNRLASFTLQGLRPLHYWGTWDRVKVLCVRGRRLAGDRFRQEGARAVDQKTGLTWQNADLPTLPWQEALARCENLEFEGFSDWRLPSAKELMTTYDYSESGDGIFSALVGPVDGAYWTSTTYSGGELALRMRDYDQNHGYFFSTPISMHSTARCVRDSGANFEP